MKRYLKRAVSLLVLAMVGVTVYQVWQFMSFHNRMWETLETELEHYSEIGREDFPRHLQQTYKRLGLELALEDIHVTEDRPRRTVRAEFAYTREIRILVFSFDKRMTVMRSLRDVDIVG